MWAGLTILSRTAWRSIQRHWRYSLGAFLSVVAGFLSLSLFRAYMADVSFMYEETYSRRNMYGDIVIEKEGNETERRRDPWTFLLDEADQAFLERFLAEPGNHVKSRVRFLTANGMISNGTTNTIFWAKGYDLQAGAQMRGNRWAWDTLAGEPLQVADGEDTIIIGRSLATILECEVPKHKTVYSRFGGYSAERRPFDCPQTQLQLSVTTQAGQANAIDGHVVGVIDGIFKEIDTKFVMLGLPLMQRLYDTKGVTYYSVRLDRPEHVPAFLGALAERARKQGRRVRGLRWQNHPDGDMYLRSMDLLTIFRNFVISIMIAITGLSVKNAFLKSVNERTREIGTLRSLGYQRRLVMVLFGMEALYLSAAGCAVALVLALIITKVINTIGILYKAGVLSEPVPFRIAYDFSIYWTSALFLIAIGVGAALFAVRFTVHRPIAENLIHA